VGYLHGLEQETSPQRTYSGVRATLEGKREDISVLALFLKGLPDTPAFSKHRSDKPCKTPQGEKKQPSQKPDF